MIMARMAMMIKLIINTYWSQQCPCSSSPCSPPCSRSTPPDPRCRHQNIVSYFLERNIWTQNYSYKYLLEQYWALRSICHSKLKIQILTWAAAQPSCSACRPVYCCLPCERSVTFLQNLKNINSLWATENVASPATIFCKNWNIRSYEYDPLHICLWITENVASHATKASYLREVLCSSVLMTLDTFLFVCK